MATGDWYYSRDQQQFGPVQWDELRQLAAQGQLARTDLIWTEGFAEWIAADSRAQLFSSVPIFGSPALPTLGYQSPSNEVRSYAGFWLRFVAYFVDSIITSILGGIAGGAVGLMIGFSTSGQPQNTASVAKGFGQVLGILAAWLYCALMESSANQATLGKMLCGIRVTDENNGRISFGRATGRHFGKMISGLILCIGFMMAGWTEKKQALHDIMAGTLVTRK